ncbi:protein DpdJ [Micromonospora sp. WMMD1128]|uniref:protein DpdJ n=1 Tax=Micromonospora sp. WMMD1128 TaxID=3015150 RepID=UPI00248AF5E0|nr:protein DpdJ [Micromonospora sp. WMMD1128]WBB72596.1 protein DpdJ [Micromonospora sp. WMMD1128]
MIDSRRFLSGVLDDLEDLELPLLSWGVTSGVVARDEVLAVIEERLLGPDAPDLLADEVLEELERLGLLLEVPRSSPRSYRTRLAETVRLTATLRQMFPAANRTGRWWDQSPKLVADYRLHVARRRYPKRDIPAESVLATLSSSDEDGLDERQSAVVRALLAGRELARFQVEASTAIRRHLAAGVGRAAIVGAGTGSGKTLAFYLPALMAIADHAHAGGSGVHTLALYPRNELLRDQLREAVANVAAVNESQRAYGSRPLRIGVLYGDTVYQADDRRLGHGHDGAWRRHGGDAVCPYLKCPTCRGDLVWAAADRTAVPPREHLRCTDQRCVQSVIVHLVLTRDGLHRDPPDLLFTTTEMLNISSTDPRQAPLLGWTGRKVPKLVLLDEAHTYGVMHGAQVALLLRRWRSGLGRQATVVGLSATLRDAADFFSELTGIDRHEVDYLTPRPSDFEEEGREYAMALRVDPVSRVSPLSTTIQAAMLHARTLDVRGAELLYGSRGFVFTDDLDVTNRLFNDLTDAEGGRTAGPRRRPQVLAGLRSANGATHDQYIDGQSWELVHRIGRHLDPQALTHGLRVTRTSSQDSGVDQDADLVVATASLEVGVDDDRVGLVIQHKAPRDAASFLQRRGRAGRRRLTRPWTVVTLSDFGRDRLTYQAYDQLFAPELPPRRLPVGNRFVLKIQATQAMLDWVGRRTQCDSRRLLRAPDRKSPDAHPGTEAVLKQLQVLLEDANVQADLAGWLRRALDISADEVTALLWEPPRSLLLSVVPTILRRLESRWRAYAPEPGARPGSLLPEFVTRTLFDPLNVPEVHFRLPFNADDESMPIERALREAVPGRVSRRYGYRSAHDRTWLPLPDPQAAGVLEISSFTAQYDDEGWWEPAGKPAVRVLRPHLITLAEPPPEVGDQSQGVPVWASQFVPDHLYEGAIPRPSRWQDRVLSVGFATGAAGNPVQIRRMTTAAACTTVTGNGRTTTVTSTVRYQHRGEPAALGFSLDVDAIRFTVAPLDPRDEAVAAHLRSPQWRSIVFKAALAVDPELDDDANAFQRRWLALVYTTAYALRLTSDSDTDAQQAHRALAGGRWAAHIDQVLNAIYRSDGSTTPSRLVNDLSDLARRPAVIAAVDRHSRLLWCDDVVTLTADLAQRAYRDTVAAGILAAAQRACPDAQDGDLIVDVLPPDNPDSPTTIWLSETAIGGLGVITQLVPYYQEDPRRFWALVDSALAPSDYEYLHDTLTHLLRHVVADSQSTAAQAVSTLRDPASAAEAEQALVTLRQAWAAIDGHPRQQAVAALSTRLLRHGTDAGTDRLVFELMHAWDSTQDRLGFEMEAAVFAYLVGTGSIRIAGLDPRRFGADQVYSLLWPRGAEARSQRLVHYQPYAPPALTDRLLVQAAHDERLSRVNVTEPRWRERYIDEITACGAVQLIAPVERITDFTAAMRTVVIIAVDHGALRVYGEVRAVDREAGKVRCVVEIREFAQ